MVVHADLTLIPISTSHSLIVASTTTPAFRHTTPPHSQGGIPASRPTCCWREPWSSAPDQEGRARGGSGGCRFARRQRSGRRPRRVCVVAQLRSSPPDNNRNLSSEELTRALLSQPLLHTIAWKRADQDRGLRVSWCWFVPRAAKRRRRRRSWFNNHFTRNRSVSVFTVHTTNLEQSARSSRRARARCPGSAGRSR